MNSVEKLKLVVFVPLSHCHIVRDALGKAGAGKQGNYDFCSFSVRGVGRYRGNEESTPAIGARGVINEVEEERIEVILPKDKALEILAAVRAVHPYEEMAHEFYAVVNLE